MQTAEHWTIAYLLNSLWQLPLFWAAAHLLARAVRNFRPVWPHRIWVAALFFQTIVPALSATDALPLRWRLLWSNNPDAHGHEQITVLIRPSAASWTTHLPAGLCHVFAAAFGCFVVCMFLRLLWRVRRAEQLARGAQDLLLEGEAQQAWRACTTCFRLPGVRLAESRQIHTPLTLGVLRPTVLLPHGWMPVLHEIDLRTVFAHECAHIQRSDYAKNLVFELIALPVAFHPISLLTRDRIAATREWVCDALAAQATSGPKVYARSLLRLAALRLQPASVNFTNAIGIFDDANTLEGRIMKLTETKTHANRLQRGAALAACAVVSLAACGSAWALAAKVPAAVTPTQSAATAPQASPVQIASGIMAGQVLNRVNPIYPQEAKDAGIEGSVLLSATIGSDGTLQALKLISGPPELAKAAWTAVSQWTYRPYVLNGEPVPVETTITVNFQLNS